MSADMSTTDHVTKRECGIELRDISEIT